MTTQLIEEFDIWRPGYANAEVTVYVAGTTTLADVFEDEALTEPAANPQTLISLSENNVHYGKFERSLYVGTPYYLDVNATEQTGVQRSPITTLSGEDASNATVRATGASEDVPLKDIVARVIHALDYGTLDDDASTNTATLEAAVAAAGANSGGDVVLPAGVFPFDGLVLPAGVVLCGQGIGVTQLLCQIDDNAIEVSGSRAGLRNLTLDGVDLTEDSVGVYAEITTNVVLETVEVKRFERGVYMNGVQRCQWRDLNITNCDTGAQLQSNDSGPGGVLADKTFSYNSWFGGTVKECTTYGVNLSYEVRLATNNEILGIIYEDNTGTALRINGARFTKFGGFWLGNTVNLEVLDDDDTTPAKRQINTVISLNGVGGRMFDGEVTFTGTCQDVVLTAFDFVGVDFSFDTPVSNNILFQDCTEDDTCTVSGEGTKLNRFNRFNVGQSAGVTTNNTATKAWSIALNPGQVVQLEAKVIGRQQNAQAIGVYRRMAKFWRPGSNLAYDTQTANFTAGLIVTGASSGATARIQQDSDSGATGTLSLIDINGVFLDNETITDTGGGSALVNGALTPQNVTILGSVETIGTDAETDSAWNVTFAANGPEVELQVTGNTGDTVEWESYVEVVSN